MGKIKSVLGIQRTKKLQQTGDEAVLTGETESQWDPELNLESSFMFMNALVCAS